MGDIYCQLQSMIAFNDLSTDVPLLVLPDTVILAPLSLLQTHIYLSWAHTALYPVLGSILSGARSLE